MKNYRTSYCNSKWHKFAKRVKIRDNCRCTKCHRSELEAILQVHHKQYITGLLPWEYPLSDCITLCKGCHAREHKKIEPDTGWVLISVDDLGGPHGTCERIGCGKEITYEHVIYHPGFGYKSVGSSCVEYLTQDDKDLSSEILRVYKRISNFVHKSTWEPGKTKEGSNYTFAKYKSHKIRIYGKVGKYAFQIITKQEGEIRPQYSAIFKAEGKNILQTKELAFIALLGKTSTSDSQKELLRNIYIRTREIEIS